MFRRAGYIFFIVLLIQLKQSALARQIYFCGEAIPTERDYVAQKLMTVIRKQIPVATLTYLRYQSKRYFPAISAWLKYYGIPDDFKYIPIVECGFVNNLTSRAGAAGFWQLMPATAREQGLIVTDGLDQRMDPYRSTIAACQVILQHYATIKGKLKKPSWVFTAASYNFGPGNIVKSVRSQGGDYFSMKLNDETAEYVYRLIAIKELFEHPELYMNGFGVNIFSSDRLAKSANDTAFHEVDNSKKGETLGKLAKGEKPAELIVRDAPDQSQQTRDWLVSARIVSADKRFKDGGFVRLELLEQLVIQGSSRRKGEIIKGKAWLIDGRVFVDFGFGPDVLLLDVQEQPGITITEAEKSNQRVFLKTQRPL